MKCPTCGCEKFYVKDTDDEYDIYEFTCPEGRIEFNTDYDKQEIPKITNETETFCNKCSWHGKFSTLK